MAYVLKRTHSENKFIYKNESAHNFKSSEPTNISITFSDNTNTKSFHKSHFAWAENNVGVFFTCILCD